MDFPVHPAASLFPLIEGEAFESFVADIKANGQMDPVTLNKAGQVIDGRNRLRACERLNIAPVTTVYQGDDVYRFVISHNLHRRHLTDSQRAMIAARIATRKHGVRSNEPQIPRTGDLPPSVGEAAVLLDVAENQVTKAKRIIRDGTDGLVEIATSGHVPITTAARVATELSPDEQDAYVERVKAGADPVKAAPPDLKQQKRDKNRNRDRRPQASPKYGSRRKHTELVDALIITLDGAAYAFAEIKQATDFDNSVTKEEAVRLTDDLSKQIRVLNRINSLIKERTS